MESGELQRRGSHSGLFAALSLAPRTVPVPHREHSMSIYCCRTASSSPAHLYQNGCFWTHIPLLCWPQADLPNGHRLGRHHHHLSDCTGHLHRHPAWHSGQDGEKQTQPWKPQPQGDLGLEVRGPDSLTTTRFRKETPFLRKRHAPLPLHPP